MKARTKEHLIRSSVAFVIVMCFLTNYSDDLGSKRVIDRILDSQGFKSVIKLCLLAIAGYLAFGKLRSEKRG